MISIGVSNIINELGNFHGEPAFYAVLWARDSSTHICTSIHLRRYRHHRTKTMRTTQQSVVWIWGNIPQATSACQQAGTASFQWPGLDAALWALRCSLLWALHLYPRAGWKIENILSHSPHPTYWVDSCSIDPLKSYVFYHHDLTRQFIYYIERC